VIALSSPPSGRKPKPSRISSKTGVGFFIIYVIRILEILDGGRFYVYYCTV